MKLAVSFFVLLLSSNAFGQGADRVSELEDVFTHAMVSGDCSQSIGKTGPIAYEVGWFVQDSKQVTVTIREDFQLGLEWSPVSKHLYNFSTGIIIEDTVDHKTGKTKRYEKVCRPNATYKTGCIRSLGFISEIILQRPLDHFESAQSSKYSKEIKAVKCAQILLNGYLDFLQ
jgi:hypothetical protein